MLDRQRRGSLLDLRADEVIVVERWSIVSIPAIVLPLLSAELWSPNTGRSKTAKKVLGIHPVVDAHGGIDGLPGIIEPQQVLDGGIV